MSGLAGLFQAKVGNLSSPNTVNALVNDKSSPFKTVNNNTPVHNSILRKLPMLPEIVVEEPKDEDIHNRGTEENPNKLIIDGIESIGENIINPGWPFRPSKDVNEDENGDSDTEFDLAHVIAAHTAIKHSSLYADDYEGADGSEAEYNSSGYNIKGYDSANNQQRDKTAGSLTALKNSEGTKSVTGSINTTYTMPSSSNSTFTTRRDWACVDVPYSKLPKAGLQDDEVCIGGDAHVNNTVGYLKLLNIIAGFFIGFRIIFA